jgi:hypothetical protein
MYFHIHYTFYIPRYFNITIFKIMLLSTGQRMVRHGWREWTIFVLNSNTVYRSIILENSTESKKIIKLICKLNECENIFTATEAKSTKTKLTAWLYTPAKSKPRRIVP